jgi:hypothetical protein
LVEADPESLARSRLVPFGGADLRRLHWVRGGEELALKRPAEQRWEVTRTGPNAPLRHVTRGVGEVDDLTAAACALEVAAWDPAAGAQVPTPDADGDPWARLVLVAVGGRRVEVRFGPPPGPGPGARQAVWSSAAGAAGWVDPAAVRRLVGLLDRAGP